MTPLSSNICIPKAEIKIQGLEKNGATTKGRNFKKYAHIRESRGCFPNTELPQYEAKSAVNGFSAVIVPIWKGEASNSLQRIMGNNAKIPKKGQEITFERMNALEVEICKYPFIKQSLLTFKNEIVLLLSIKTTVSYPGRYSKK